MSQPIPMDTVSAGVGEVSCGLLNLSLVERASQWLGGDEPERGRSRLNRTTCNFSEQ
jgi:hypothetical protein